MKSVGEYPNKKFLCKSVKSVGEYPARKFCVFCEICGRISQQECVLNSVGEYRFCCVGALLALASGKAERRHVHPLESTITSVCEIRGRIISSESEICGRTYQQKEIYFLMLWSLRYCVGDMPRWLFVNLPKNERLGKPSSSEISLIERLERRRYFSIAFTV